MLNIFGEYYYLDLDVIDDYIQIKTEESTPDSKEGVHLSVVKYETIKLMIEVLMDEHDRVDESLIGMGGNVTIPFKLAFNTLLNKKILNKY
jgi:hypothetical protein